MRETNNRRLVDSGVKCGVCDFGNAGGVVNRFISGKLLFYINKANSVNRLMNR